MKSRLSVIAAMVIFGTIGIFRKYIDLPSSGLAVARGLIGAAFLLLVVLITGKKLDKAAIKSNLWLLLLSGAFIGINWMLLFESYRYTTVATATLCYYLAPVFVVLLSPLLLKEKLSPVKGICAAVAVLGMVFVSGVFEGGLDLSRLPGILFGVGAAAFYAAVILLNKKMKPIPAMDCTVIQLAAAALVLVPYTLLVEDYAAVALSPLGIGLLVAVGVVHTGIAYALYFGKTAFLYGITAFRIHKRKRIAVYLFLYFIYKHERVLTRDKRYFVFAVGKRTRFMMLVLDHTEYRYRKIIFIHYRANTVDLIRAAVDKHQIGIFPALLIGIVREPAAYTFLERGKVVTVVYGIYIEPSVFLFGKPAVLKHYHSTAGIFTRGMRNIIGFYSVGQHLEPQQICKR